jgi:hypothetical protein
MNPFASAFDLYPSSPVRAVIRYVLNPSSPAFKSAELPWKICCEPRKFDGAVVSNIVYRGQSGNPASKPGIPRVPGTDPMKIQLNLGKPISTSRKLSPIILKFATPSPGRLFEIYVTPGVRYVSLKDAVGGGIEDPRAFEFLLLELPDGSWYKKNNFNPDQLRTVFNDLINTEDEVLLDPASGEFKTEDNTPETWDRPERVVKLQSLDEHGNKKPFLDKTTGKYVKDLNINVYTAAMFPKAVGGRRGSRVIRGRTLRSHSKRRDKNGRRLAHKPKTRRHRRS